MTDSDVRVGVLGLSHDHVWANLDDLLTVGGAVVVAAADAPRLSGVTEVVVTPDGYPGGRSASKSAPVAARFRSTI